MRTRLVSVPFRGSCSEIGRKNSHRPCALLFPSPFGVRVLKSEMPERDRHNGLYVSVPFRGSCSEIAKSQAWRLACLVSVPFRGSCSEIARLMEISAAAAVSVPFRGSCSEILLESNPPLDGLVFPSPFGVRVLKLLLWHVFHSQKQKVSVPFRGSCSEI